MRILHLIQCTNLGGMEQTTLQRMVGLTSLGHQCKVLSLNPLGALSPQLRRHDIKAEGLTYKGRGGWRSLPALYRKLRHCPADAILMTGHNLGATLALPSVPRNRRVLSIHFHHTGVLPDWQWRLIYRAACSRFRAITFPTDFIRYEAEKIYPPVAGLAVTLPNPFVIPPLPSRSEKEQARRDLGIPDGVFVVGNAGWLVERKRFDVFLCVVGRLANRPAPVLGLIAGDGPKKAELQSLALSLGIADRVRWLGWQDDLRKFYLALDVLVFNSDWDALGRTPLEALALGTPMVASVTHGGLAEVIDRDSYGYLTSTHDVDWLSARAWDILANPGLAGSTVEAARSRIVEYCNPKRDLDRLAQLLELNERPSHE
jgi:glycosyltransferase involved in cell wall biosynthesis